MCRAEYQFVDKAAVHIARNTGNGKIEERAGYLIRKP